MTRGRLGLRAAALALVGGVALGGCSGTDSGPGSAGHGRRGPERFREAAPGPEAATPAGAVRAMFAAYRAKDLARWLGAWSDQGFVEAFGVPKAEAALVPPSWGNVRSFRESVVTLRGVSEERAGGGRADVVVETAEAAVVTWHRLELRPNPAGRWLVAGRTPVAAPVDDRVALQVSLVEGSIGLARPAAGRDVNLRVVNAGTVPHEMVLLRARGGIDQTVGRVPPLAPGSEATMVARGLPPGDYALVCNLLDPQGRPHSAAGMRAELHVTADGP